MRGEGQRLEALPDEGQDRPFPVPQERVQVVLHALPDNENADAGIDDQGPFAVASFERFRKRHVEIRAVVGAARIGDPPHADTRRRRRRRGFGIPDIEHVDPVGVQ
ncbi:MAG: hypothetical protein EDX89_07470, partial [Acidobacteria bacterium]